MPIINVRAILNGIEQLELFSRHIDSLREKLSEIQFRLETAVNITEWHTELKICIQELEEEEIVLTQMIRAGRQAAEKYNQCEKRIIDVYEGNIGAVSCPIISIRNNNVQINNHLDDIVTIVVEECGNGYE